MLNQMKKLTDDQNFIRKWLERINETDSQQVSEVMDLMRTDPDYHTWIMDYAGSTSE